MEKYGVMQWALYAIYLGKGYAINYNASFYYIFSGYHMNKNVMFCPNITQNFIIIKKDEIVDSRLSLDKEQKT